MLPQSKELNGNRKDKNDDDWKENDDTDLEEEERGEKTSLLHPIPHEPIRGAEQHAKSHRIFRSARKGARGAYELRRVTWADDDHGDELEEEFIIPSRPFIARRTAASCAEGGHPLCILAALLALIFLLWITLPKRHRL
mmetsp:Transcript_2782/g.6377  ORF Transcript_2782/g.6377 Transcript_2782/m.6377 type:complete len:139 (-) Transcript_2782:232-648(-)